ncbi:MAG: rfaE bifunctional protein nucleotidyltransferase chain/domain [Arenicella sp.]|jgi:rfaE bifunctional protein nucleotidyltransferase chain/domain
MPTKNKIQTLEQLVSTRKQWENSEEKVIFSNGCFDILHLGHIDYLEKASQLGNRLIIGLNTDVSVRKLKGESRPINPEYARARILAALEFVDAVVLFGEETPLELISTLLPDVLVKGNDYSVENIVGAKEVLANGGEVKTISLVEGFSTTSTIEKMKA